MNINKKNISIIVAVVVVIIIAVLGFNITKDIVTNGNKKTSTELTKKLETLNKKYPEAKAWLKVNNTTIDMPVFQSKDNNKYLRLNRDGKEAKWGEAYLDYRVDLKKINDKSNIIIYGHNTEQDTLFTPLLKYKNEEFFKKNKTIQLAIKDTEYKFEIISAFVTDTNYFYIDTEFKSVEEYDNFTNEIKSKSIYDTGVKLKSNDTILTLSTCEYSIENGRFVVVARLVK